MTASQPHHRPPGRPRGFDQVAALDTAMELFWQHGYAATTVPDISAATGLSTSSLYNTFGSKLDLYAAALGRYNDRIILGFMLGPLEHGDAGLADVDAFLVRLAATTKVAPPRGCLAVNTIAEFRDPPPEIAAQTKRYLTHLRRALHAALVRAAADREVPADSAGERADALVPIVVAFNLLVAGQAPARAVRETLRAAHAVAAD